MSDRRRKIIYSLLVLLSGVAVFFIRMRMGKVYYPGIGALVVAVFAVYLFWDMHHLQLDMYNRELEERIHDLEKRCSCFDVVKDLVDVEIRRLK